MMRAFLISWLIASPAIAETLVATRVVRPAEVITAADFAVAAQGTKGALASDADIVGLEAKVTLYPGRPILPEYVGAAAIIERNQPITLVFRKGPLTISTDARALSRGAVGDLVKVMNLASRTTVSGRIMQNGSVVVNAEGGVE